MPSDATTQLVEGFNAPLGTFSSRIKAAYSIGLITKEQFQDLEILRKIRNEFAHNWKPVDMAKQKIAALIDNMTYSRLDNNFPTTSSEKIRSSMSCLLIEICASTHQIKKRGTQAKLIGNHLMCGFSGDFASQIKKARAELDNIVHNLEKSQGKEVNFYLILLVRFKDRLTVLAKPENPEQKKELTDFYEYFDSRLRDLQANK
ncbi:transcriptional regulator [Janthinobacterium sp. FW305-129]|nr:transcriptional regulator [Janthinobacterium sp. FW305-129]